MKHDKAISPAIREYRMAFEEYFKDKPKQKNDKEFKKQMDDFLHWYNNVRKQSDTAERYRKNAGRNVQRVLWRKPKMKLPEDIGNLNIDILQIQQEAYNVW